MIRAQRGHRTLLALTCLRCGGEYFVPPHRVSRSRYCSQKCTKIVKRCLRCNNIITRRPGRRRFCSHRCASAWMVGPRASVWKGGISKRRDRGKLSARLRAWSQAVLRRDNFRCQECGATVDLQAHHVKSFARYPRLRTDVANGITLCVDCHGRKHGKNFRARRVRMCSGCGAKIKNKMKTGLCRSCALKKWHASGRPSSPRRRQEQLDLFAHSVV
jgi:5-methylcytosine-specific restriction endonuclease McrA